MDELPLRSNWHLLDARSGEFDTSKAKEVTAQLLVDYPDIDVLYCESDGMALGALEAIKAAGKIPGKDIVIISFGGIRAALDKLSAGELNCVIESSPVQGPLMDLVIGKVEKERFVDKEQFVEYKIFDQKNISTSRGTRLY